MAEAENDLTPEQWAALLEAWGGCAYCGQASAALQRDCVLAISRGGRYTLDNGAGMPIMQRQQVQRRGHDLDAPSTS